MQLKDQSDGKRSHQCCPLHKNRGEPNYKIGNQRLTAGGEAFGSNQAHARKNSGGERLFPIRRSHRC